MKNSNFKYIVTLLIAGIHTLNAQNLCGSYSKFPIDSLKSKIGSIIHNSESFDTCLLGVIEYCKDSYVQTDKRIYLEIIDSCWKHSDGYISDLISEVSTDLIGEKFEGWFKYVYENRYDTANRGYGTIENLFVEGMVENGKQNAEEKINSVQASPNYTAQQKKYLKKLFEKTNFTE